MKKIFLRVIYVVAAAFLSGCGGSAGCDARAIAFGGGLLNDCSKSNTSSKKISNGYFVDSPVGGARFVSGNQSGKTGTDGSFTYEEGEPITFYVGGLKLGSASSGAKFITPIDLVSGGSILNDNVINITAFLLSLDENNIYSDGIKISSAIQAVATNWSESQINFNQPYLAFSVQAFALTGIALPSKSDSVAHLTASVRCLQSGIFTGTWTEVGGVGGTGGYFVKPSDGIISGGYVAYNQSSSGRVWGNQGINLNQDREFVIGNAGSGAVFSGSMDRDGAEISGTWSNSSPPSSGTFSASRLEPSYENIKYRVNGFVEIASPELLLYSINIDLLGKVVGKIYSIRNNRTENLEGNLLAGQLSVSASSGEKFTATLNMTTGVVSNAIWTGGLSSGVQVRSDVGGCLLNGFGS
jgi:hypothetical protein